MKGIFLGLILVAFSVGAQAGVKEKKAIRKNMSQVEQQILYANTACGASITVDIDWEQIQSIAKKTTNKAFGDKNSYDSARMVNHIGQRTVNLVKGFGYLCEKDADYKEELAKIKTINVTAQNDYSENNSELNLDADVLSVQQGHRYLRGRDDFVRALKGLY